jgi:hypothetical protein
MRLSRFRGRVSPRAVLFAKKRQIR